MDRRAIIARRLVPLLAACLAVALHACGGQDDGDTATREMSFGNGTIHYTDSVTDAEVKNLGDYLTRRGFFGDKKKAITLDKSGERYKIFVLAEDGLDKDVNMLTSLRNLGIEISKNAFDDAKVDMYIVNETQQEQTLIPAADYGARLTFNGSDLFYTPTVTEEEARTFGNFLVQDGFFTKPQTVQLNRNDSTYQFRFMVADGRQQDPQFEAICRAITTRISKQVFGGAPVEIHLCDHNFQTLKVITQPAA